MAEWGSELPTAKLTIVQRKERHIRLGLHFDDDLPYSFIQVKFKIRIQNVTSHSRSPFKSMRTLDKVNDFIIPLDLIKGELKDKFDVEVKVVDVATGDELIQVEMSKSVRLKCEYGRLLSQCSK